MEMKIISFIKRRQSEVIEKIPRHCGLWDETPVRAPPAGAVAVGMRSTVVWNRPLARASQSLCHCCVETKSGTIRRVNYWNIIADTLDSLNKARLWNSRNLSAPDKDAH